MKLHQMTIDEIAMARRNDPATSKTAARMAHSLASEHRRKIVEVLRLGGDWTPEEIAARCGLTALQVCRRMHELRHHQAIESGATRPTASGRPAQCWRLAQ